ncbi:PAS domain S-box protein [Methanoculleus sp. Wushi-C6]|uniref:histidine kinase n=1 Tax=Methanoculleus caldifontis TaxID=2651577 RepID=A0ABU3X024_9EURY|nr:PAS domain S-box protein [Methanoculleus sp. Wushi-C6]MDV2481395.1 PAS domain S-box protein [Methanoculleus sp. Wushi-C6]
MKVSRPDQRSGNTFTWEHLVPFCIIASALLALATVGYCLSAGVSVVTSHLFYIPIVLAAYYYPDRGVAFAGAIAAGYLTVVLLFAAESEFEVVNALLRVGILLAVAAVVSYLAARLRARESRYRGVFENSGAGIFLFSPETGKVLEMNRGCSAMLGYSEDEVRSLEVPAFWPGYPGIAGALKVRGVEGLDCDFIRRDGTSCPVLLSANLLPDGRAGCAVVTGTAEWKWMANRLRRSEETFRVILNAADVGILLTDPGKRVVEVNTAAIRLFGGAGPEDLVGRNPEDLIAERDREAVRAYRERVLSGKSFAPGECTFRRLDGTEWTAEVSVTCLPRDGDAPERLVVSLRDITEQRRVEEAMREEYRYLMVVNEVVAAATASRKLDDLLKVSLEKTVALLGFELGAVYLMRPENDTAVLRARVGMACALPATMHRDDPLCRDYVAAGEVRCIEDVPARYPGAVIRFIAVAPIPGDDGPVGWIAVGSSTRDAVSRSERGILLGICDELGNAVVKGLLQEDLEKALAAANRYLEEASAAAAEINLYVDVLTHDINNANTAAMGYLQMYLESGAAASDGVLVEKSLAAVHQSNEIIRNVSTIRRLRSGSVELGPVDLEPVIRGLCEYHMDNRITFDGTGATVLADDLIGEVFVNLIGNSMKFGGPEVRVAISVREEGDEVSVTVADTGPGIPDHLKPRVFERYQRGDLRKSGKGLGLYIVRMLAERYGGSVRAGDRVVGHPEEGAAVTFTLRRYIAAAGER